MVVSKVLDDWSRNRRGDRAGRAPSWCYGLLRSLWGSWHLLGFIRAVWGPLEILFGLSGPRVACIYRAPCMQTFETQQHMITRQVGQNQNHPTSTRT
jgi:hypothetical protein